MLTRKRIAAGVAACLLFAVPVVASADGPPITGPFSFYPIAGSAAGDGSDFNPDAPWILPPGFTQTVVYDESHLDIYKQPTEDENSNDWHDMNTVNETGAQRGRYLYTTHEVRGNKERGGSVTVTDLATGATKIIAEDKSYDALDGIEWTPWGTLLFAEEVTGGRLFEIVLDPNDPTKGTVYDRPAVGRMAHEGIQVDSAGNVYVVDEFRGEVEGYGGGIYKFVPDRYGDLSTGKLYALAVKGDGVEGTGQGSWVGPINPGNAPISGTLAGAATYNRPEDLEIIGNTLYAAITEGTRAGGSKEQYDGKVIAINLDSLSVVDYVKPGMNVPVEKSDQTGFDNPDNLAEGPNGYLVIVEDNNPSDIWFVTPGGEVVLFASLTDDCAEGTGIYFSPMRPSAMFVNVQHSCVDDGDATWLLEAH